MSSSWRATIFVAVSGLAAAPDGPFKLSVGETYVPDPRQDFPNRVLLRDTRVHTADAGLAGPAATPNRSYRSAYGETVTSSTVSLAHRGRPLDWLVVTDHAETTGFGWRSWEKIIDAAERHNVSGAFTGFIGYEWTPAPGGRNLHCSVIFRDVGNRARRVFPVSVGDTEDPEPLRDRMEIDEGQAGGRASETVREAKFGAIMCNENCAMTRTRIRVRVLDIPSPRWTVCDAKSSWVALPEEDPRTILDRIYPSPIRYSLSERTHDAHSHAASCCQVLEPARRRRRVGNRLITRQAIRRPRSCRSSCRTSIQLSAATPMRRQTGFSFALQSRSRLRGHRILRV